MLTEGTTRVTVLGQDGAALGSVSLQAIANKLGPESGAPAP